MIQTALFFILGFLSAAFLAVLFAPTLMRRSERLTRKRIEESMPIKMSDIQADKDRVRAEYAMATRKLEINAKALNEKNIQQTLELEKNREEFKRLGEETAMRDVKIAGLEGRVEVLESELSESRALGTQISERLAATETSLQERTQELSHMGRLYDDATFSASNRQIELAAQEARVDQLSAEISGLRTARNETDAQMREVTAENKTLTASLLTENRKIATLEKQLERLTTTLSDIEEKLERRERELDRLRTGSVTSKGSGKTSDDDDLLRNEIGKLAAEVVNLTATLEGPNSPIFKALETPVAPKKRARKSNSKTANTSALPSLADRIRDLQKATQKAE